MYKWKKKTNDKELINEYIRELKKKERKAGKEKKGRKEEWKEG